MRTLQVLEVRDSGPGIPAEKLTTIFEPFYTSKREGIGLGLSICRFYRGLIWQEDYRGDPPEGGADFRVFLRTFVAVSERAEQAAHAGT